MSMGMQIWAIKSYASLCAGSWSGPWYSAPHLPVGLLMNYGSTLNKHAISAAERGTKRLFLADWRLGPAPWHQAAWHCMCKGINTQIMRLPYPQRWHSRRSGWRHLGRKLPLRAHRHPRRPRATGSTQGPRRAWTPGGVGSHPTRRLPLWAPASCAA